MSRVTPLFLALDQGGHATRAIVFDYRGKIVASAEKHIATHHIGSNRVEHAPQALLASIRLVCRSVAAQLGAGTVQIRSAGLATQRSTIVCWNRQTGRALSPVISWQDRRAAHRIQALDSHAHTVHKITGLVLSPHYGASKLAWCLDKLQPVRTAFRQERLAVGPLASFIMANALVEKPLLADPVNASRTLLWDYRTRNWSRELLKLFGIPVGILPVCVPNKYDFGHLRIGQQNVPLALVTGDQPAALFAGGQPKPENIYVNLGTGAFIQRLNGTEPPRVRGLLGSVLWQDQRNALYVLEGTVNGAASALTWLCEQFGITEKAMIENMPKWLALQRAPPLFLNGIAGLGSPYWKPDFRSRFIGRADSTAKFVAVVESIIFQLCANLERMDTQHAPARRILVSGGLARWQGLCQRLADMSGLPVFRNEQHEATARGLAVLLGMGGTPDSKPSVWMPKKNPPLKQRYINWQAEMRCALTRPSP